MKKYEKIIEGRNKRKIESLFEEVDWFKKMLATLSEFSIDVLLEDEELMISFLGDLISKGELYIYENEDGEREILYCGASLKDTD